MGRLTRRVGDGVTFNDIDGITKGVAKLADYEDAEEQGRLLKMPFEIGQKIYIIAGDIGEMLVAGYEILGDSQMLITAFVETPEILGGNLDMEDAGKRFFATREEAEAKLKEMEGSDAENHEAR